jgi:hypothetical protein
MPELTVTSGLLSLTLEPALGGRITSLRRGGAELLVGRDVNPTNWGATYWTSPQADWGWPPLPGVDSEPYAVLEPASLPPGSVVLRSVPVELGERRFRIEKRFCPAPSDCIDARYRIENLGDAAFRMASWEISRVAAGGVTFFPTGQAELSPIAPHGPLEVEKRAGLSLYDHRRFELGTSLKLHADGQEGWLAHQAGGLLLLKLFADMPPARQAPGEGEIELFANLDGRYVEVEVQGPCDPIEPGGFREFAVRTHVAEVPPPGALDAPALRELVTDLVLGLGHP